MRRGFVLVGVLPLVAFGQQAARSEPADGRTQIRGEKGEGLTLGGRVLDPDGAPRAPHGTVLRPEFSMEVPEQRALPARRLPGVAPGRACTSITAIPPGTYRVRVVLDDGRTLERAVALAEGATTLVTLAP